MILRREAEPTVVHTSKRPIRMVISSSIAWRGNAHTAFSAGAQRPVGFTGWRGKLLVNGVERPPAASFACAIIIWNVSAWPCTILAIILCPGACCVSGAAILEGDAPRPANCD